MRHRFALTLVLLLAAALRIVGVYNVSPPGLAHDEVANWLIDRAILDEGKRGVYFTEAYGHEAGFHYVQAASVALVGDNALALRLPALLAGVLLVALCYALTRQLFGREVALIAAALLAVLFWPVFYSRLALRAISLPVVAAVSLYGWWRGWEAPRSAMERPSWLWFALAGVAAGLTAYTYMAARAVPIFYGLFIVYLALFHRPRFRRRWRAIALFVLFYAVVALPLVVYLQSNPGAEFRISEVDAPLRALREGDLGPVVQNGRRILGMFAFSGDPLWRQNVAERPVFDPLLGLLFYVGVGLALWRWRDARYAFLLLWLGTAALPSLATVDAPSTIRMINALLVITVFPALVMHTIPRLSTVFPKLSTNGAYLLAGLFVLYHIWWTGSDLFNTWPQDDEVQFVWQAALTETAAYLDASTATTPVAIGGWSPATMDPPTMALSLRRDDLDLRYFGSDSTAVPVSTVILPAGAPVRVTHPLIRDFTPMLSARLAPWRVPAAGETFALYALPDPLPFTPEVTADVTFGGDVQFLGYDRAETSLLTYWRVLAPTAEPRRFFLHAVDVNGAIVAQHDGLDAPAVHWRPGDVVLQEHTLPPEAADSLALRLGVYNPDTGQRLLTPDGADFVVLP